MLPRLSSGFSISGTGNPFQNSIESNFDFARSSLSPSKIIYPRNLTCLCSVSSKQGSGRNPSSGPRRQRRQSVKEKSNNEQISQPVMASQGHRNSQQSSATEENAVKDFIRKRLHETFATISQDNLVNLTEASYQEKENIELKGEENGQEVMEGGNNDAEKGTKPKKMVVEEDSSSWPLDAEVGWGIRASDYFEEHSIKNVVDEGGVEVDWVGELDDTWVQEINCLEWENFAFHPSPLVVLVFERYNKVSENWKTLKELEKAVQVYWRAKDRLPPRTVKLDINIERDMAYALKVTDCPQILFLRGHRIIHREKAFRTAEELVQMIAHFYYNAKRPGFFTSDGDG